MTVYHIECADDRVAEVLADQISVDTTGALLLFRDGGGPSVVFSRNAWRIARRDSESIKWARPLAAKPRKQGIPFA